MNSTLWSGIACVVFFVFGMITGMEMSEQTCENRITAVYQSHGLNDDR